MWMNDNIGTLQWAAAQKCSSMASHYANLVVTQLHIQTHLRMVPPIHKPGINMGDIDTMILTTTLSNTNAVHSDCAT